MHRTRYLSYSLLLAGVTVLALATLLFVAAPQVASAQCGGETSSCLSCHVMDGDTPFDGQAAWHNDHVTGGFCTNCHLGDKSSSTPDVAMADIIASPQIVPETACASCHEANYEALNAVYLELAPAEASVAPITVDPLDAPVDPLDAPVDPLDAPVDPLDAPVDPLDAPVEVEAEPVTVTAETVADTAPDETGNRILLLMAEGLFVLGLGTFWFLERRG